MGLTLTEVTAEEATTVIAEFPDIVGSLTLVAVIVTLLGLGTAAGAVYAPPTIVPFVLLPPVTPFTDQVTALLNAPVPLTCAVNN
jgi:hypothetical protein